MTREKIKEKIVRIIEDLGVYVEVSEESSLANDLGFDSLDVVELTINVEKEFKIDISDDEVSEVKTVKDVIDVVEKLLA